MFYVVTGEISFQLAPFYYDVLRYWVETKHLENIAYLFPTKIRFNGFLELDELYEICVFLNRFASIDDSEVFATKGEKECVVFNVCDGVIYEYPYAYCVQNGTEKPLSYMVYVIQEEKFTIHINYDQFSPEEKRDFDQAILAMKVPTNKPFDKEFSVLASIVEKKYFIELLTAHEKLRWDKANTATVSSFPFKRQEEGVVIAPKINTLANYERDETETRTFHWNKTIFPLHDLFLSDSNEKNIQLPIGEPVNPCSQCAFRLRKLTNGCVPCVPKLIPRKE